MRFGSLQEAVLKDTDEEIFSNLLPSRIRTKYCQGTKQERKVSQGQTAKYRRTCFWNTHPVYGTSKNKYHRHRASKQSNAHVSDSL